MASLIHIEVIGLKDISCSPFPCDNTRSCGLYDCYPSGKLVVAFNALADEIQKEYGDRVAMTLTLIDDGVPPYVQEGHRGALPASTDRAGQWELCSYGEDLPAPSAKRDREV